MQLIALIGTIVCLMVGLVSAGYRRYGTASIYFLACMAFAVATVWL